MTPITTTDALASFCDAVQGAPFIAVDTEFMRETTYWPKLCLIQAATADHEAIIDPQAEGLDLSCFLDVLRDPNIVKVFHAARQDTEIFVKLGPCQCPCSTPRWRRWRRGSAIRSPMIRWFGRC
jgi:ribonuclease D